MRSVFNLPSWYISEQPYFMVIQMVAQIRQIFFSVVFFLELGQCSFQLIKHNAVSLVDIFINCQTHGWRNALSFYFADLQFLLSEVLFIFKTMSLRWLYIEHTGSVFRKVFFHMNPLKNAPDIYFKHAKTIGGSLAQS